MQGGGRHCPRDVQVGQQAGGAGGGGCILQAAQPLQHVLQPHLCTHQLCRCNSLIVVRQIAVFIGKKLLWDDSINEDAFRSESSTIIDTQLKSGRE